MRFFSFSTGLFGFLGILSTVTATTISDKSNESPPNDSDDLFLGFIVEDSAIPQANISILEDTFDALFVLQKGYFSGDYGTWPNAIDWTAAVAQTLVTGTLATLSKTFASINPGQTHGWIAKENLISSFFAQVVGFYFGQDVLSIRGQAYDDMLWVVLGWIEALKFVSTHSDIHYPSKSQGSADGSSGLWDMLDNMPWHGRNWIPSFAHRSRIFWNLAGNGWGTRLCHGGMNWNPRLQPYKNAITNELWIAGSVAMYQHFPGDNFTSPWLASSHYPDKDPAHLAAAIDGYKWLMNVNMTNNDGLFVDGYHINFRKPGNVECDLRNEMVYTYNQGVILTGQRGLWAVTGAVSYLKEGHTLVQSVIKATGWSLRDNEPLEDLQHLPHGQLPRWRGIGRGGILEERCDTSGSCSQDGQTFKGIFFYHLTAFCEPLERPSGRDDNMAFDEQVFSRIKTAHATACRSYLSWIQHNALAALGTRDVHGRFGMWWGASVFPNAKVAQEDDATDHTADNAIDYRNHGTPDDDIWGREKRWSPSASGLHRMRLKREDIFAFGTDQYVMDDDAKSEHVSKHDDAFQAKQDGNDPNDRGRGRSVETQIGGLAVLRAYWEMSQLASD